MRYICHHGVSAAAQVFLKKLGWRVRSESLKYNLLRSVQFAKIYEHEELSHERFSTRTFPDIQYYSITLEGKITMESISLQFLTGCSLRVHLELARHTLP